MTFCSNCGKEVQLEDRFCKGCGYSLKKAEVATTTTTTLSKDFKYIKHRPTGVTILAILEVLGGIFFFGLGSFGLFIAGIIGRTGVQPRFPRFPFLIGGLIGIVSVVMIVIGIINLLIAYGYWNGRGWSWTTGFAFAILGLIIGLVSLPGGIIRIIFDGLIVYYLTRPYVKRFFKKEPVPLTM
jgi:hypothetical protein